MQRRTLLLGIGGCSLAVAGCLDSLALRPAEPARPTELVSFTFETDVNTALSRYESGPQITADEDASEITIEGVGRYGSSRCGYLDVQQPAYDSEPATLAVEVTAEQDRPENNVCEDDESGSSYRVVARFDDGVPARVEAEQPFEEQATAEFP